MSWWTQIVAAIEVDTYKEDKNIKQIVEQMLIDAPKITGSERNADIFVNVKSGHNTSTNCDCEHCEYKNTIVHLENNGFRCDADENYQCPVAEYQTRVVITILGSLRDRMKEKTEKKYKAFVNYLKKKCKFDIKNSTVNIIG